MERQRCGSGCRGLLDAMVERSGNRAPAALVEGAEHHDEGGVRVTNQGSRGVRAMPPSCARGTSCLGWGKGHNSIDARLFHSTNRTGRPHPSVRRTDLAHQDRCLYPPRMDRSSCADESRPTRAGGSLRRRPEPLPLSCAPTHGIEQGILLPLSHRQASPELRSNPLALTSPQRRTVAALTSAPAPRPCCC